VFGNWPFRFWDDTGTRQRGLWNRGSGNDARLVGSVAIAESLHARARSDSKVTGDCAAELQRNAIAAIVNVLATAIAPVHITLSLLCGEQQRQNRRRDALENRTGRVGRAIHVTRTGRRLQND
jgi:hypothetical protein